VTHLCPFPGGRSGGRCLGVRRVWEGIEKELLRRLLWIMFSSCWYASMLRWYEFNLLYRNRTTEYLCLRGGGGVV
jgi:hypothetical protein